MTAGQDKSTRSLAGYIERVRNTSRTITEHLSEIIPSAHRTPAEHLAKVYIPNAIQIIIEFESLIHVQA